MTNEPNPEPSLREKLDAAERRNLTKHPSKPTCSRCKLVIHHPDCPVCQESCPDCLRAARDAATQRAERAENVIRAIQSHAHGHSDKVVCLHRLGSIYDQCVKLLSSTPTREDGETCATQNAPVGSNEVASLKLPDSPEKTAPSTVASNAADSFNPSPAAVGEPSPAHNPDHLTPEQVGVSDGWRLLDEDEVEYGGNPLAEGVSRWWYHGAYWQDGWSGQEKVNTYRTRLSRAELRKARGLDPVSPSPPSTETGTPRTDELWVRLMKACKKSGISPTLANEAFSLLTYFRTVETGIVELEGKLSNETANRVHADEKIAELQAFIRASQAREKESDKDRAAVWKCLADDQKYELKKLTKWRGSETDYICDVLEQIRMRINAARSETPEGQ